MNNIFQILKSGLSRIEQLEDVCLKCARLLIHETCKIQLSQAEQEFLSIHKKDFQKWLLSLENPKFKISYYKLDKRGKKIFTFVESTPDENPINIAVSEGCEEVLGLIAAARNIEQRKVMVSEKKARIAECTRNLATGNEMEIRKLQNIFGLSQIDVIECIFSLLENKAWIGFMENHFLTRHLIEGKDGARNYLLNRRRGLLLMLRQENNRYRNLKLNKRIDAAETRDDKKSAFKSAKKRYTVEEALMLEEMGQHLTIDQIQKEDEGKGDIDNFVFRNKGDRKPENKTTIQEVR